ncbi:hypothetical protein BGX23_005230 [Mortierella sp. AD031]|nr:hypothetical protein BGX23_005230 [Mortierella sp. AD031]
MIDLPEILHHIASFLDAESRFACISVCQQWNELFTPYLWHTRQDLGSISDDDSGWGWDNGDGSEADSDGSADDGDSSEDDDGNETGGVDGTDVGDGGGETYVSSTDPEYVLIPLSAFDSYDSRILVRTRASWRLILGLRQLAISTSCPISQLRMWVEDSGSESDISLVLHPISEVFLNVAFSRLSPLQHLDVGLRADDFLLSNLATALPNLTSFVHSELSRFTIRNFARWVNGDFIYSFRGDGGANYDNEVAQKEFLEFSSLESLVTSTLDQDFKGFLGSRIKFPRLTKTNESLYIPCANSIHLALWSFLTLQRLQSRNSSYGLDDEVAFTKEEEEVYCQGRDIYPIQELLIYN